MSGLIPADPGDAHGRAVPSSGSAMFRGANETKRSGQGVAADGHDQRRGDDAARLAVDGVSVDQTLRDQAVEFENEIGACNGLSKRVAAATSRNGIGAEGYIQDKGSNRRGDTRL